VDVQKKKPADKTRSMKPSVSKPQVKQRGDPFNLPLEDAIKAELKLQATLAKKLGLKKV
jgi:hypothetical protein